MKNENPVRSPLIINRVRELIALDAKAATNRKLVAVVLAEFQIRATTGQIASALSKEGISRGGTPGGGWASREGYDPANKSQPAGRRPKLPALPSEMDEQPKPAVVPYAMGAVAAPEKPVEAPVTPPVVKLPAPIVVTLPRTLRPAPPSLRPIAGPRTCQWPMGDSWIGGGVTFACTDDLHPGRPYCLGHCRTAYQGFDPHRFSGQLTAH